MGGVRGGQAPTTASQDPKFRDLGFEGRLHEQAGDVFKDVAQVTVGGEQLVNLCADALLGRTRLWVSFRCSQA